MIAHLLGEGRGHETTGHGQTNEGANEQDRAETGQGCGREHVSQKERNERARSNRWRRDNGGRRGPADAPNQAQRGERAGMVELGSDVRAGVDSL